MVGRRIRGGELTEMNNSGNNYYNIHRTGFIFTYIQWIMSTIDIVLIGAMIFIHMVQLLAPSHVVYVYTGRS